MHIYIYLQPIRDLHLALGAKSLELDDDLRAQSLPTLNSAVQIEEKKSSQESAK